MNYKLKGADAQAMRDRGVLKSAFKQLMPLLRKEKWPALTALMTTGVSSGATLIAPLLIAHAIDAYIVGKNFSGLVWVAALLLVIYIVGALASYMQIRTMGGVGRRVLYGLRRDLFMKLGALPVAFFNQNKAGDLISRINNDTDKLNQFFSQALMQFMSNLVLIAGAGVFLLSLNIKLGLAALAPAALVLLATQLLSPWVKRVSLTSLRTLGGMSGEVQESLNNFKVIVAFNRLDYFRDKFAEANEANYRASVRAGIASNTFSPIYTLAAALGQLIVLIYGIHLIVIGQFSVGLLVGFLLYVYNFYNPLRQLAAVWSSLQLALAGLDRISEVMRLRSNMPIAEAKEDTRRNSEQPVLELRDVSFSYDGSDKQVLREVSASFLRGKTYALVGPTGGGKTTTASLMARLYDPTEGAVYLSGRDLRSFSDEERAGAIGFILQEPYLFSGTVKENILYGNEEYLEWNNEKITELLREAHLAGLLSRFSEGLETKIAPSGDSLSLGQKQIIAFMRAVLRRPAILILDEATANIDTVTEQLLEDILEKLPEETTRVIIAHRLNTIENADEIFFVNGGEVMPAGTMAHAVQMLLSGARRS